MSAEQFYGKHLCKSSGHVFNSLTEYSWCSRCGVPRLDAKQPEPKKEKPMANIAVNVGMFDGLSLHQRIQALIELTTWRNQAREERSEAEQKFGERSVENGCYIAHYMREDALNVVLQNLIDSTVEKFGGVE